MVLFYDYKFLKMGIPGNEWFFLFLWFFFLITNFQKWVYKEMGSFFLKLPIPLIQKVVHKSNKTHYFYINKTSASKKMYYLLSSVFFRERV